MRNRTILAAAIADVLASLPAEPIARDDERKLERVRKHFIHDTSKPVKKAPVRKAREVARLGVKKG